MQNNEKQRAADIIHQLKFLQIESPPLGIMQIMQIVRVSIIKLVAQNQYFVTT